MSIEGQGHFFTIYFPGFVCFVLPRYQVSVYRTIGPLVRSSAVKVEMLLKNWEIFFLAQDRLCAPVGTASLRQVLTSIHNLCFEQK